MATNQDIRIRLQAYDYRILDKSASEISETARRSGAIVKGPTPLPTKTQRWTFPHSPHVHQKHGRTQVELLTHKRVILLVNPTDKTMDALMKLELAAGVDVEIKVVA